MLLDMLLSLTEHDPHIKKSLTPEGKKTNQDFDLQGKINLAFLLFKKCTNERTLNYLSKNEPDTIFVPLMMDMKYAMESSASIQSLSEIPNEINKQLNHLYKDARAKDKLWVLMATTFIKVFGKKIFNQTDDTFDQQYANLVMLKSKHPNDILPFIAVDPRRPNISNLVTKAIQTDHFAGVKLYCPNGYSPIDPRLDSIYKFCIANSIPVTAHCSYGGVATAENDIDIVGGYYDYKEGKIIDYSGTLSFTKKLTDPRTADEPGGLEQRALMLNHPHLWNEVLNRYKGLRLNLAHMGVRSNHYTEEEQFEWSHLIVKMMLEHENLYTDLSCRTESDQITSLWNIAENADPHCNLGLKVTDRVMYGTDFWLSMLSEDMHCHLKAFEESFEKKEYDLIRIRQTNPARFLGI